ncbi:MAG: Holliday junction branch migration protein RuvA [Lachnospiraceae bacterium]|nr:Holliday junction branch migration protein RuvA [Lachnospiraceae bacterium]
MINFIYGKLREVADKKIVVEVNGMGFDINFPSSNIENLPKENADIKVYTYMAVKEDEISLYGFLTKEDKEMFLNLIECDGVGPKGAMKIISELGFTELINAIARKDDVYISKVPGIGKKTASKICIELADKIKKLDFNGAKDIIKENNEKNSRLIDIENEVVKALMKLGYKNKEAKAMVEKVGVNVGDTSENVLKKVLKKR